MITLEEALSAVADFHLLQFYPNDPSGLVDERLARLLVEMVPNKKSLDRLRTVMVKQVGCWHGPVELRGVLCTFVKPLDGVEANCEVTPGFRCDDLEMKYIAGAVKDSRLSVAESSEIRKLLDPGKFSL